MNYVFENNLCLYKTNKYKTINLSLNFAKSYDLKEKLALNILASLIGEYSLNYPDKRSMTAIKDKLYGANITCDIKYRANLMMFSIKYSFINPKFLKDVKTCDFTLFFKELIDNALFNEDLLNEYKRVLKDTFSRTLDKPRVLALNNTLKLLAKQNKELDIYDVDLKDQLDTITLDDLKETYHSLFNDYDLKIFLTGDYDDELLNYVKSLPLKSKYTFNRDTLDLKEMGEVIEEKDISQSILNVVYKTPYNRYSKDFYAFALGNVLLGEVPTSLLFDEVREKRSLCYYISVVDYKNEGLVRIHTAIEGKNKDEVVKQIDIQIKRLINKDYDPSKLDIARSLFMDSLDSSIDDNDSLIDYLYANKLNGVDTSLEEYKQELLKVTVDDIARVFKDYKHVLTYLLRGTKDE